MLEVREISKKLGDFHLDDISLKISKGEYFMLLGPSGAGKSVILETIAGMIRPDKGSIWLNGGNITEVKMQKRGIGLVFQGNTVFPHMSVRDNLLYPLKILGIPHRQRETAVTENAERVGISHLLGRMPARLSGGEAQRVIIARALGSKPQCLLLDEPLSSLDIQLKENLIDQLRKLNQEGLTILHVTHDFHEAFALGSRMAIIDNGRMLQTGFPQEIAEKPASRFVASFLGMHNYFRGIRGPEGEIILEGKLPFKAAHTSKNEPFQVLIPPNAIQIGQWQQKHDSDRVFSGKISRCIIFPDKINILVDIGIPLRLDLPLTHPLSSRVKARDMVAVTINPEKLVFPDSP